MLVLMTSMPARAAIYASSTSNITTSTATLNATISGSLLSANNFYFQLGTSTSYGRNISAANTFLLTGLFGYFGVDTNVASLSCSTTYQWRVVQDNYLLGFIYVGSSYGPNQTFTTAACAPVATTPGVFAVFEGTVSNSAAATSNNRVIQTRVAGAAGGLCSSGGACGLKVAAMNNGAINTSFSGTVTASLEACTNVSRSSGVTCGGSWGAIVGSTQTVALAAGVGTLNFPAVADVYEVVRVKVVSTSPALTAYAEDYFAIRPASLSLGASDATPSTAGNTRSLTTALNSHKAGQPFTLAAQALTATGALASRYPGSAPGPVLQSLATLLPVGGVNGSLSMGAWSGSANLSTTATYDEVGTFSLALQDQNFADVDAADTPAAQRYFSGSLAQVGRFTPDHFVTELTPACPAGVFTYSGQPFVVKVTAQNAANSTTQNYKGTQAFAHTLSVPVPASGGVLTNTSISAINFAAGSATSNSPTYTFNQAATQPANILVRSTDADGISSNGFDGSTNIRSGRVAMKNAFGSEMLSLPLPLRIETYNNGWVVHTADTCTNLNAANFAWSPGPLTASSKGWQACDSALMLGGTSPNYQLLITSPGAGKQGWADVALLLGNSGSGGACTSANGGAGYSRAAVPAMQPWLQYNWRGSVGNPSARVTFGQYNSRLIDMRENF
jgi:MSHA biogenesis protein MshQ